MLDTGESVLSVKIIESSRLTLPANMATEGTKRIRIPRQYLQKQEISARY